MLHKSKPDRASEFNIHINKIVPIGSGLGGGSSNASTTIKFLNQIWDLNYSSKRSGLSFFVFSYDFFILHSSISF